MLAHNRYNYKFPRSLSNIDKIILFLYSLYFVLAPFYLWRSGLPQISDFFMIFLFILYTIKNKFTLKIPVKSQKFITIGILLTCYIVFINLTWTIVLSSSTSFIRTSLFYIYNFMIALVVSSLYRDYGKKFISITYKSALASVLVQFMLLILQGGYTGGRMTGTFNNPNQLAYYSLLIISLLIFTSTQLNVKARWFILGIITASTLVIVSLSTTAIISFLGIILFYTFSKIEDKKLKRRVMIIIIVIISILVFLYMNTNIIHESSIYRGLEIRANRTESKVNGFYIERGYSRIIENPQYWLFGSGEGAPQRFGSNLEIHSTLGNIQMSYGLIGASLFLSILYISIKNNSFKTNYILIFIMFYGLTHNGIRNSMLWILLALMAAGKFESANNDTDTSI